MSNVFREAKHNQVVALEQLGWLFGRIAEEIGEGNKQTDVVKPVCCCMMRRLRSNWKGSG
jgi:hypothetical protein